MDSQSLHGPMTGTSASGGMWKTAVSVMGVRPPGTDTAVVGAALAGPEPNRFPPTPRTASLTHGYSLVVGNQSHAHACLFHSWGCPLGFRCGSRGDGPVCWMPAQASEPERASSRDGGRTVSCLAVRGRK